MESRLEYTVDMEFFNSFMQWLVALVVGIVAWIVLAGSAFGPQIVVQAPTPSSPAKQNTAPTSTTTSTTTVKKTPAPTQTKTPAPVPASPPAGQAAPSSPPLVITNDIIAQTNTQTRPSLVNILCNFRTTNTSSYISGSGLMVDPHGVVLTNAHVAQFFLLQNRPGPSTTSCTVRTGSPATAAYTAQLLYLPPLWISANASKILSASPTGTGERDYAFLYITGPAPSAPPLPASFPALALSTESPKQNAPVLLAGYPAGFLDANGVNGNLYISSAVSAIQKLYTFDSASSVDLVSLGGTVVSQSGSSGGAVINLANNKLVALIATESEGTTTASRDLRALTLAYINRNLAADGKGSIATLLSGDLLKVSQDFNATIAPALTKQLVAAIEK